MRLWHIDLIPYLPKSQLLAQKRECDLIWKDRQQGKKTNHILINYIWEYGILDFVNYYFLLEKEFKNRSFKFNNKSGFDSWGNTYPYIYHHNHEYLTICYYNLKEKYLRGQKDFTDDVWQRLDEFYQAECVKQMLPDGVKWSKGVLKDAKN